MPLTSELTVLHRALDDLRRIVGSVADRYGDIPAVKRLFGDIERFDLDASELDAVTPQAQRAGTPPDVVVLDDRPVDPSLWADADDEGLGGFSAPTR
jgi:hypothetical protein